MRHFPPVADEPTDRAADFGTRRSALRDINDPAYKLKIAMCLLFLH